MTDKFTVTYSFAPMQPRPIVTIILGKPRIPYIGAILDFITHPLVWYPMWIGIAVIGWKSWSYL